MAEIKKIDYMSKEYEKLWLIDYDDLTNEMYLYDMKGTKVDWQINKVEMYFKKMRIRVSNGEKKAVLMLNPDTWEEVKTNIANILELFWGEFENGHPELEWQKGTFPYYHHFYDWLTEEENFITQLFYDYSDRIGFANTAKEIVEEN